MKPKSVCITIVPSLQGKKQEIILFILIPSNNWECLVLVLDQVASSLHTEAMLCVNFLWQSNVLAHQCYHNNERQLNRERLASVQCESYQRLCSSCNGICNLKTEGKYSTVICLNLKVSHLSIYMVHYKIITKGWKKKNYFVKGFSYVFVDSVTSLHKHAWITHL